MSAGPHMHPGAQVLVVEDNAINQGTMLRMLALGGIRADLVSDGRQAVERCRQHRYALVLMDVQMPVMDGLEAARLIRAGEQPAPVIVGVSAHAFAADRRAATSAGMSEYLAKPVRLDALLGTLRKYLPDTASP